MKCAHFTRQTFSAVDRVSRPLRTSNTSCSRLPSGGSSGVALSWWTSTFASRHRAALVARSARVVHRGRRKATLRPALAHRPRNTGRLKTPLHAVARASADGRCWLSHISSPRSGRAGLGTVRLLVDFRNPAMRGRSRAMMALIEVRCDTSQPRRFVTFGLVAVSTSAANV